jgi:small GTP-binding protein
MAVYDDRDTKDARHKVVMLGNSGVGKTSIVLRLSEKIFKKMTTPTVGSGTFDQQIATSKGLVRLTIWDTAGEERYKSFAGLYSQEATAGILVFDVSDKESFGDIADWIRLFQDNAEKTAVLVLAGNKVDLIEQRTVTGDEARAFAANQGIEYFDVSAKTGENIDRLFSFVAEHVGPGATTDCLAVPIQPARPKQQPVGCGC